MRARLSVLLGVAILATGLGLPARADGCTAPDPDATPKTQDVAAFGGLRGHYALPANPAPTRLVVYAHGYRNLSDSWVCHLLEAAVNNDAVAVAMDYRGTGWTGGPADHRGWFVAEGAEDSIFAARYFMERFPSITKVGLLGISMGGNTSGLAVAAKAKRTNGAALFDYWVNVEGVGNLIEEYLLATAVGPVNAYAAGAAADMERECGGNLAAKPDCFRNLTLVARAADVAGAGLKGAAFVHGVDDGLVPYNQTRELAAVLRDRGMGVDVYSVLRRNDGDPATQGGTTATGTFLGPLYGAVGQTYPAPLAGHGWEGNATHIVIATGFARLWALMDEAHVPGNHDYVVDSSAGTHRIG